MIRFNNFVINSTGIVQIIELPNLYVNAYLELGSPDLYYHWGSIFIKLGSRSFQINLPRKL